MNNGALVIGSGIAGHQATLDLADSGIPFHMVEVSPFLCEDLPPEISEVVLKTRLLDVLDHPHISVRTNSNIDAVHRESQAFQVDLHKNPHYVDLTLFTACEECIETCPATIAPFHQEIQPRKAICLGSQPGCCTIDKPGISPCASACPGGIHVQGYVVLIAQGRFQQAYDLIHQAIPFPSVCGRVCNHYCEAKCKRGKVDQPVNIMALKRFVIEWAYARRDEYSAQSAEHPQSMASDAKKVATIGAGSAGLTAGRESVRPGHVATIFDALPAAGGTMWVGIPPHRLPDDRLDWEIEQILSEGVELRLNTWIDPAICTGCGTCDAHCPSGAISAGCSTDPQLEAIFATVLA